MPIAGYLIGLSFKNLIVGIDHWIAFLILGGIGLRMIITKKDKVDRDDLSLKKLLVLAIATSIDALIIGMSFIFLRLPLISSIFIIGLVTIVLSLVGFYCGKKISFFRENNLKIIVGLILIFVGLKILIEHLV